MFTIKNEINTHEFTEAIIDAMNKVLESRTINHQESTGLSQRLLNTEDVMNLFRVSRSTIHTWRLHQEMPFQKVGTTVRFDRNDVLKWARERQKHLRSE